MQDKLINLSTENATTATNAAQCFWLCGKLCTTLNSAELGIQLGYVSVRISQQAVSEKSLQKKHTLMRMRRNSFCCDKLNTCVL